MLPNKHRSIYELMEVVVKLSVSLVKIHTSYAYHFHILYIFVIHFKHYNSKTGVEAHQCEICGKHFGDIIPSFHIFINTSFTYEFSRHTLKNYFTMR